MRPRFHFTAERGWINDPHGITVRDGEYHSFFQYVPESTVWAPNCHWGHAKGADLFSLPELPVALAPGEGDDGIWTGSLVTDDDGSTRIFYTATTQPDIGIGRLRVATPDDDGWITWTKGSFVAEAPAEARHHRLPRPLRASRTTMGGGCSSAPVSPTAPPPPCPIARPTSSDWEYEGIALSTLDPRGRPGLDGRTVGVPADHRSRRPGTSWCHRSGTTTCCTTPAMPSGGMPTASSPRPSGAG